MHLGSLSTCWIRVVHLTQIQRHHRVPQLELPQSLVTWSNAKVTVRLMLPLSTLTLIISSPSIHQGVSLQTGWLHSFGYLCNSNKLELRVPQKPPMNVENGMVHGLSCFGSHHNKVIACRNCIRVKSLLDSKTNAIVPSDEAYAIMQLKANTPLTSYH